MIKNIVFDMGQVLIYWNSPQFMEAMRVPQEDRELVTEAIFHGPEWNLLDRGTLPEEEAIRAMSARLPERLHCYVTQMVLHWWEYPLLPVPGMGELVEEVKGLGYGVYLLSNASSHLHEYFHRIPGCQCFDGKIVSADWKLLKPEPAIFQTLFREYGLRPEECFFIDDLPANIQGALDVGMAGAVFYDDVPRLRQDLRAAGIPVKA